MNRFLYIVERYKYGLIAAIATYIGVFIFLELETYESYYKIEPFYSEQMLEIKPEDLVIEPEQLIPQESQSGEVRNIARDMNDQRSRSMENWSENRSSGNVVQSVKDYERQLFEESGGAAQRQKIQQEMEQRKKDRQTNTTNQSKQNTQQTGGNTAYAGNVMVDWSLAGRSPHQNNNWYVRNPGYTCGHGASGRVTVSISVDQNGDVVNAVSSGSGGANACMIEQALKYAKLSRFNYSSSSPKIQQGTITYVFVSQ